MAIVSVHPLYFAIEIYRRVYCHNHLCTAVTIRARLFVTVD